MSHDIIIVGGRIVGSAAALLFAKYTPLKIAVIDATAAFPSWDKKNYQPRVSAVSLASRNLFESLGVWEKIIAKRISPYLKMHVWESDGSIDFHHKEVLKDSLGSIIEDAVMCESLHETFLRFPNISFLHPVQLKKIEKKDGSVFLHTTDQKIFSAKLLVAADGAHSWVREQLDIAIKEEEYGHTAIVATVKTEKPHEKTAYQRFMPNGPLAFLPLDDPHYCSIVWSTKLDYARELMQMDDADFCKALTESFEHKLGQIVETQIRHSFALSKRHAVRYVEENVALVGDAAHTIHPLAGQGMNLGLSDVAALSELVTSAVAKNRDYASLSLLRRYERSRKSENATMMAGVGMLKQLFESEKRGVKAFRNQGLNVMNRLLPVKRLLIEYALGL